MWEESADIVILQLQVHLSESKQVYCLPYYKLL